MPNKNQPDIDAATARELLRQRSTTEKTNNEKVDIVVLPRSSEYRAIRDAVRAQHPSWPDERVIEEAHRRYGEALDQAHAEQYPDE